MSCTNPLTLLNEAGTVPCGKCLNCRIQRAKEWSIRLMHESFYHDDSIFLTLTYDDEYLPEDGMISKIEAQNFIKRLRKHLEPRKIRYFITGEYGDESDRPHYHAIIFNLGLTDHNIRRSSNGYHVLDGPAKKSWKKGWIQAGTVTPDSTLYVAGYIQKKLYGPIADDREQPFSLKSLGLGKPWLEANKDLLTTNCEITFQGKKFPVPNYYIRKLELQDAIRMKNEYYHALKESHYDRKYPFCENPGLATIARDNHRKQLDRITHSKQNLKRRTI